MLGGGRPLAGRNGHATGRTFFSGSTEKNSSPVSKSQAVGFLIPRK